MSDFEIRTGETIFSMLNVMQFVFEALDGRKKEDNQKLFQELSEHMPVQKLKGGIYYRARIIKDSDGEDTGIIRENGIPITGYNVQYSGVAPIAAIKQNGRVNRIGEQVLYLAEDMVTSCKEQKAEKNTYISVAECSIKNEISLVDFTITASIGLNNAFSDEIRQYFNSKYSCDVRALYICLRAYFENPKYNRNGYIVPLDFLDFVKRRSDISGIKYFSSYTGKCNIALWDENRNSECKNSKVIVSGIYEK